MQDQGTNKTADGSQEELRFTVSMLTRQIEVSVPATALISQLRGNLEREVQKPKIKLVGTTTDGISFELSDDQRVADIAVGVDLAAVAEAMPLVVENGSDTMRAGFAGEERPRVRLRTTLKRSKKDGACTVGVEVDEVEEDEVIVQPILHGLVRDWEAMEKIWRHLFVDLDFGSVKGHSLILTEPPLNPKANRIKMMQTMFEIFEVDSFFMSLSQVLKLSESGRSTGLVADIGTRGRVVLPIYEGFSLLMAANFCSEQGGEDLSDELQAALSRRNPSGVLGRLDRSTIRRIKEKMCYVAEDPDEERRQFEAQLYEDAVRGTLTLESEIFEVSELFFADSPSLCDDISTSVARTDMNCRSMLMENVLLTGGSAALRGLNKRLTKELEKKWPMVRVLTPLEPGDSAWCGGSYLGSIPDYANTAITQQDYEAAAASGADSHGNSRQTDQLAQLVERKCF